MAGAHEYVVFGIAVPGSYIPPEALRARVTDPEFGALVIDLGSVAASAVGRGAAAVVPDVPAAAEKRLGERLARVERAVCQAERATMGVATDVAGVVRAFGGSAAAGTIGSAPERGAAGEEVLAGHLVRLFPTAALEDVAREARRGDFRLVLPAAGASVPPVTILVESKNVKRISREDVDKFRRDLAAAVPEGVGAGLFVSLLSPTVPHRGAFCIEAGAADARPAVYVAGVLADPGSLRFAVEAAAFLGRNWGAAGRTDADLRPRLLAAVQRAHATFESQAAGLRAARRQLARLQELVDTLESGISRSSAALDLILEERAPEDLAGGTPPAAL